MDAMTTACLYRSHRLYDHPYTVRNPYSSTVPCIPPAQVHGHSQVNLSDYHIHTRPHTQPTPRRTTPPRIVTETPKRRRIVDMSPGLLAGLTRACEKAGGHLDDATGFRGFGDYSRWGGPTRVRSRRWCLGHVNICSRVICLQRGD